MTKNKMVKLFIITKAKKRLSTYGEQSLFAAVV